MLLQDAPLNKIIAEPLPMPAHRQPRFAAAVVRWSHQARSAKPGWQESTMSFLFLFFLMGISRVCCVRRPIVLTF